MTALLRFSSIEAARLFRDVLKDAGKDAHVVPTSDGRFDVHVTPKKRKRKT